MVSGDNRPDRCTFGPFALDLRTGELRRDGRPVHLAPQPTRLLLALARQAGRIVTRDELKASIWGNDTFVDFDQGLKHCVKQLRAALDDDAENPRFIETVPRRGYRLNASIEQPDETPAAPPPGRRSAPVVVVTILGLVAIVVAAVYVARDRAGFGIASPPRTMIAVLPFENLSGDPSQEFFSDGFTEELIGQLGKIDPTRLGVIARTSTLAFKGSTKTATEIGRQLHAAHVVEGSLRRSGNRVRIDARLIRTADQSQVWTRVYEGEVRDILALQHEVGNTVARQIVATLAPLNRAAQRAVDPDVYDLYLRGRFAWNRRVQVEIDRAVAYFQEAARRDPTFAPAHAGVADALLTTSRPAALAAAEKALAIDERLAEAHTARGHALLHLLEWDRAEEEFRRAIALDPSYVPARYFYAEYLVARNRPAEAVTQAQQGLALDPLSAVATHTVGVIFYFAHRYDDALPYFQKALEIDPEHTWSHGRIALVLERQRSYDAALTEFEFVQQPIRASYTYGVAGSTAAAQRIIRTALERPDHDLHAYHLGSAYVGIGAHDDALKWLQVALGHREYDVIYLAVDPRLEPLHSRPEFQAMLREGGWK